MMRQTKQPTAEYRNHLVYAVAENKTSIENRDVRLRRRNELAVQVHPAEVMHRISLLKNGIGRDQRSHNWKLSIARWTSPPAPTSFSATSGYSASGLSSMASVTAPRRWPYRIGA